MMFPDETIFGTIAISINTPIYFSNNSKSNLCVVEMKNNFIHFFLQHNYIFS